jgi:endonuclease/exonuclease/phosphatase family metal-dependent hydrolase
MVQPAIMIWIFVITLVLILLVAYQGYAAKNYLEPNAPFYSGDYALGDMDHSDQAITIVTYNIAYALNIDQAIADLRHIRLQKGLDILLLQEMDEPGMEKIARDLQLNYVYYPAAVESTYHKDFGNAVLSCWPITDSWKLILPHISFSNRMKRIATRATIQIHGKELVAYSIHTEPVFTLPQFKVDQYTAVLNEITPEDGLVIVGGDFNSFTRSSIETIGNRYRRSGLERVSRNSEYTFVRWGIKFMPDHILAKGFAVVDGGKFSDARASDHFPVWVRLVPG